MIDQDLHNVTPTWLATLLVSKAGHLNFGRVKETLFDQHFKLLLVFTDLSAESFLLLQSASHTRCHFNNEICVRHLVHVRIQFWELDFFTSEAFNASFELFFRGWCFNLLLVNINTLHVLR